MYSTKYLCIVLYLFLPPLSPANLRPEVAGVHIMLGDIGVCTLAHLGKPLRSLTVSGSHRNFFVSASLHTLSQHDDRINLFPESESTVLL